MEIIGSQMAADISRLRAQAATTQNKLVNPAWPVAGREAGNLRGRGRAHREPRRTGKPCGVERGSTLSGSYRTPSSRPQPGRQVKRAAAPAIMLAAIALLTTACNAGTKPNPVQLNPQSVSIKPASVAAHYLPISPASRTTDARPSPAITRRSR